MRRPPSSTTSTDGMIPIIAIVGRTNSGKTTLIEQLIPALARRGYRVATIKHHHHGDFRADHPGKDSWRHAEAGAVASALAGTHRLAVFQRTETELSPEQIARLFVVTPDLVLTEGYKDSLFPKVEIIRKAQGVEPLCRKEDQLIALVTDDAWDLGVPRFGLDDVESLAEFLIQYVPGPRRDRGAPPPSSDSLSA
jgi:molybdopterin-guanine dinucleotide biosynthesis protein B